MMTVGAVTVLGAFTWKIASGLAEQKPVDDEDVDYAELALPLAGRCVLAGCLAALCGIGGGMVIGPILVQMKVKPPVAAATTGVTLLVLASSTTLVYACRGTAPWRYACLLSACTFLGSLVGKSIIGWYVKQTRKQSLIVWILAGITMLSTVLLATVGVKTALAD